MRATNKIKSYFKLRKLMMTHKNIYDASTARSIERKWQKIWEKNETYKAEVSEKEPFYILDMFPFPSGSGLHVGHPLGYIGTDTRGRFERMKNKNVLHTMGFDSFGLAAEQYAIETNQHPEVTTNENIKTYKQQLKSLGLGHDETRSVETSNPEFYKWTQWIFIQLFNSYFDEETNKAQNVEKLITEFQTGVRLTDVPWSEMTFNEQQKVINSYRLAYKDEVEVNWCPGLGTVLSDSEITSEGLSDRGNYPVFKQKMKQWVLKITAYSERLYADLEDLNWPDYLKTQQRNWIGTPDNQKMKNWVFSRQRYWGEPFPIVFDSEGIVYCVPTDTLPVTLPEMVDFKPPMFNSDDSTSKPLAPLERVNDWIEVQMDLGDGLKTYYRETNTMPNWAGSSWYYLKYLNRDNSIFIDPEIEKYWMGATSTNPNGGVDLYVGGVEHINSHLIYARFWHKFLYDLGFVTSSEPFNEMFNQGYVQASCYRDVRNIPVPAKEVTSNDGKFFHEGVEVFQEFGKMGKSLKNVITPEEVSEQYGVDTFRLYLMSMAPLNVSRPWDDRTIVGSFKLLQRLWRLIIDEETGEVKSFNVETSDDLKLRLNVVIKEAETGYKDLSPNIISARIGSVVSFLIKNPEMVSKESVETLIKIISPLTPHFAEEIWEKLGYDSSIIFEDFPTVFIVEEKVQNVKYPIQVNGKVKAFVEISETASIEEIKNIISGMETIEEFVKEAKKIIIIPKKIVSIVV